MSESKTKAKCEPIKLGKRKKTADKAKSSPKPTVKDEEDLNDVKPKSERKRSGEDEEIPRKPYQRGWTDEDVRRDNLERKWEEDMDRDETDLVLTNRGPFRMGLDGHVGPDPAGTVARRAPHAADSPRLPPPLKIYDAAMILEQCLDREELRLLLLNRYPLSERDKKALSGPERDAAMSKLGVRHLLLFRRDCLDYLKGVWSQISQSDRQRITDYADRRAESVQKAKRQKVNATLTQKRRMKEMVMTPDILERIRGRLYAQSFPYGPPMVVRVDGWTKKAVIGRRIPTIRSAGGGGGGGGHAEIDRKWLASHPIPNPALTKHTTDTGSYRVRHDTDAEGRPEPFLEANRDSALLPCKETETWSWSEY